MPRITDTPEAQDKAAGFIMMTTLSRYLAPVWGEGEEEEVIVDWAVDSHWEAGTGWYPVDSEQSDWVRVTMMIPDLKVALQKAYELGGMDMREEMYQTRGV